MQFDFLKKINLPVLAVVFAVSISAFAGIVYLRKDDPLKTEINRLVELKLPEAVLLDSTTGKDIYHEIIQGEVVLVYLVSTCDACKNELPMLSKFSAEQNVKLFGVMSENEDSIKRFIRENNINFPILIDKNGGVLSKMDLKYFPSNFKLENGTVKKVILGVPENEKLFSDFIK